MPHNTMKPDQYYIPLDGTHPDSLNLYANDYIEFTWWPRESYRPTIKLFTNGYSTLLGSEDINVIMVRLMNAATMTYDGPPPHVEESVIQTFPQSASEEDEQRRVAMLRDEPYEGKSKLLPDAQHIPPEETAPRDWVGFPEFANEFLGEEKMDVDPLTELAVICRELGLFDD